MWDWLDNFGDIFGKVTDVVGNVAPLISTASSLFAGNESKKTSYQNAEDILKLADREAEETLISGHIAAKQLQASGKREIGMAVARAGASGLQIRGSILDSIGASYANLEMDRLNTLYNAHRDASLLVERAKAEARNQKSEGTAALTSSITDAAKNAGKVVGGLTDLFKEGSSVSSDLDKAISGNSSIF